MKAPDMTTTGIRFSKLMNKVKTLPTCYIMTSKTFEAIQQHFNSEVVSGAPRQELALSIYGVPFETYPTLRECLDRMLHAKPGENPLLILSEIIPEDLLDHDYIRAFPLVSNFNDDQKLTSYKLKMPDDTRI